MKNSVRIYCMVLIFSVFFLQAEQCLSAEHHADGDSSKSPNRIAIAALGDSATSVISGQAGRAPYYLLFDGNGMFLKSFDNPSRNRNRRASAGVVDLLLKESAKTVIAGTFGDKMKKALGMNRITYLEQTGIAKEIVESVIKSKRSKHAQE